MSKKDELQDAEPPKAKSSKIKIIVIIAVVVTILAAGGGGAYFYFSSHKAEAAGTEGEKNADAAKKKSVPVIYPLEAFIVNIGDGNDMRYLKVKVELETGYTAENVKKEIDPLLAPLRHAILVLLTTKSVGELQDLAGKNKLREEVLATVTKVIPDGKVTNIYFTDFVVQ